MPLGSGDNLTNEGWSIWLGILGLIVLWGGLSLRAQECGFFGSSLLCGFGVIVEVGGGIAVLWAVAFGAWATIDWRRSHGA
jgi:hypothetical protein